MLPPNTTRQLLKLLYPFKSLMELRQILIFLLQMSGFLLEQGDRLCFLIRVTHCSPGDAKVSSLDGCHALCSHGHLKLPGQAKPRSPRLLSASRGVSPTGHTFLCETHKASPRQNSKHFMLIGARISYKDTIWVGCRSAQCSHRSNVPILGWAC